jgi:ApbE superfamily uncharacterized protein (UPF0280 family)
MRERPTARLLPNGRLLLQHGPIDLVIAAEGEGEAVRAAREAAMRRFEGLLAELCEELPLLRAQAMCLGMPPRRHAEDARSAVSKHAPSVVRASRCGPRPLLSMRPWGIGGPSATGPVVRRMQAAVAPFAARTFITPMAAVAGAVAEEILGVMVAAAPLRRAFVNNGGDIALHLAEDETTRIGLVDRPDRPSLFGATTIAAHDPVRGVATSGYPGRSFSRGIAEAVTVLARTAAEADAAATVIANAVDLPGHPAVGRVPANTIQTDSDLGDILVTRSVSPLSPHEIEEAIAAGLREAALLRDDGLIEAVAIHLQGTSRVLGLPDAIDDQRRIAAHA